MHSRSLIKTNHLPKETWETPEWIPSENVTNNNRNYGKLAWNSTNYQLIPKIKKGQPSQTLFRCFCSSRKGCSEYLANGTVTK